MHRKTGLSIATATLLCASAAPAQEAAIKPDKTVIVPAFELPPSVYASPQAVAAMPAKPTDPEIQMRQMLAAGMVPAVRPSRIRQWPRRSTASKRSTR